jgi:hypothetical protein
MPQPRCDERSEEHVVTEPYYRTNRLSEAAYLLALGHRLVKIEPSPEPRFKLFVFPIEAASDGSRFYQGAEIEAQLFASKLSDLKAVIFPRVFRSTLEVR